MATEQPESAGQPPVIEKIKPVRIHEFADDVEMWERQPGETDHQWRAFRVYRDLPIGERTYVNIYKAITGRTGLSQNVNTRMREWRVWWRWDERTFAYDRYQDDMVRRQLEARRMEARIETADLGQSMRRAAAQAVAELKAIVYETKVVDGETVRIKRSALSVSQIAKLADIGVKLERLALGEDVDASVAQSLTIIDARQIHIADDELVQRAKNVIDARSRDVVSIDQL